MSDQIQLPAPTLRRTNPTRWRQAALFAGALLGGTLAGAGGLSYAAIMNGSVNWHHGRRLEMIQRHVHAALDGVGASTVQENKVHDIIASGFSSLGDDREAHQAMRKQVIDLLRAPTIDRAAVEKLRADQVARFDARSKAMMGMVLDSADQLSPVQRTELADKAEAMMARGPGGWHRWGGDRDGGPNDGGMHDRGGHGPDDEGGHGPKGGEQPHDSNPG